MKKVFDQEACLNAFSRTIQYLNNITASQDLWFEIGKALINFFDLDVVGFGKRSDANVVLSSWSYREGANEGEFQGLCIKEEVGEVLDSAFMAMDSFSSECGSTYFVTFIPITIERTTKYVLILGQRGDSPLSKELLNIFLAVGGMIGTIAAAMSSAEKKREMEIAMQIQTALLPQAIGSDHFPGMDISAAMVTADEVGGDYYDVIKTADGRTWFLIGDVSGHGLISGLIMMMVQTSIQSILIHAPVTSPADLLVSVNKAIKENIAKLGESKYMTLTAFAVFEDNKICFSGMHQDFLVYRASEGAIETIKTNGMWIGILDNIKDVLIEEQFAIHAGDVLLLYTDGVTEAYKRSGENAREMYGMSRLSGLLLENAQKTSSEIGQQLLSDLAPYEKDDDVTFVVVKRGNA